LNRENLSFVSEKILIMAQDLSCFQILNLLRQRLFLKWSILVGHIDLATKAEDGSFLWIDLDKTFHSHLLATCFSLLPKLSEPSHLMAKKAVFACLLDLLNGCEATSFFDFFRVVARTLGHLTRKNVLQVNANALLPVKGRAKSQRQPASQASSLLGKLLR